MQQSSMVALGRMLQQRSASAETLAEACEQAWQAGASGEDLELAREECGRRRLRQAAEEALLAALQRRSFSADFGEQLRQLLRQAEQAAVSRELLGYAAERFEEGRGVRGHVLRWIWLV